MPGNFEPCTFSAVEHGVIYNFPRANIVGCLLKS